MQKFFALSGMFGAAVSFACTLAGETSQWTEAMAWASAFLWASIAYAEVKRNGR